jgi:hypothetical protein
VDKGIDYSMGQANFDPETGIHFGVISQGEVLQVWCDSSEPNYGKPTEPIKCECGELQYPDENVEWGESVQCETCGEMVEFELDDMAGPLSFSYEDDGYMAECGDDGDIFIIKSPYYTYCQFCSPCAPGTGYLMNVRDEKTGIKAYCFGHDWFDDDRAPYLVYSVETNELIEP